MSYKGTIVKYYNNICPYCSSTLSDAERRQYTSLIRCAHCNTWVGREALGYKPSEPHTIVPTVFDNQVGGNHYQKLGTYQPWKVFPKWLNSEELKGFMKCTAIVYLQREEHKNGRQDIEKAMHTIQLYLEVTKDEVSNQEHKSPSEKEEKSSKEESS